MGLLEEAIRDHLDLKRRHGADPADIERAEREALGPARREPEDLDEGLFEEELEGVSDPGYGTAPDLAPGSDTELEPGSASDLAVGGGEEEQWQEPYDHETEVVPSEERLRDEPEAPSDAVPTPHHAPESAPPPEEHPPPPAASQAQETEEYNVELEREGEAGRHRQGEEMLEETPEFLQDTPEHDRLWFEQRPPRDFDFDG